MQKRQHKRFTKRIEVEFNFGERNIRGISSDLSEKGVFVRTRYPLATGSSIEMTFYLPGGVMAKAQGIVRRAVKSQSQLIKNGMGVELTGYDDAYSSFLSNITGASTAGPGMEQQEYRAVRGGPDRVGNPGSSGRSSSASASASHGPSAVSSSSYDQNEFKIIACPSCGVKNKIPASKLTFGPKCGKCKTPLTV